MNWMPHDVLAMGHASLQKQREGRALEFAVVLWRWRALIASCILVAILLAVAAFAMLPRSYTSEAMIQVDFGRDQSALGIAPSVGLAIDPNALVEGEARLIRSLVTARRVVRRLGLEQDSEFAPQKGIMAALSSASAGLTSFGQTSDAAAVSQPSSQTDLVSLSLLRGLSVRNDSRSYLISVSFASEHADRSAAIANAFADEYLESRLEAGFGVAQRTTGWLGAQVDAVRKDLDRAEETMAAFRRDTGFIDAGTDGAAIQQGELRDVMGQLGTARLTRISEEARLRRARSVVASGQLPLSPDLSPLGPIQRVLEAESVARQNLAETVANYGESHPGADRARETLMQAKARIGIEVERVIENMDSNYQGALETEQALQRRVNELEALVIRAKANEVRLRGMQADATSLRERLKLLTDSYEKSRALFELKPSSAKVVMAAEPVSIPSGPNQILILGTALVAGAGLGISASLLLERRDTGFSNGDQLTTETEHRCIVTMPEIGRKSAVVQISLFWEAIRLLALSSCIVPRSAGAHVVLITSTSPKEGKSFIATALARCLVGAGQRVLSIDTSPRLAGLDSVDPRQNLELWLDKVAARSGNPPDQREAGVHYLRRSTGLEGGERLLANDFLGRIQAARCDYDTILIEAPPIELVSDAIVMATVADVVILLVRGNSTRRDVVKLTLRRLSEMSVRVAGVVLTRVEGDKYRGNPVTRQRNNLKSYTPPSVITKELQELT